MSEPGRRVTTLARLALARDLVVSGAAVAGLLWLWRLPRYTFQQPSLWLVVVALVVLVVKGARGSTWLYLLFLWGSLSVLWSLAPGNTLVYGLWALVWLAAFAAGRAPPYAAWLVYGLLLERGLETALVVRGFGLLGGGQSLELYAYGAGALLVALPTLAASLERGASVLKRAGAVTAFALAAAMVVLSGSRAVYLALLVAAIWIVLRSPRRERLVRLAVALAAVVIVLVTVEVLVPHHPISSVLTNKVLDTTDPLAQKGGEGFGNVGWRLRMWRQIGLAAAPRPLGVGMGSFPETIAGFMRYPLLWSRSGHNIVLETWLTGGIVGVILLVGFLARTARQSMRWGRPAAAIAALALWCTMLFSANNINAGFMTLAFFALGQGLGSVRRDATDTPGRRRAFRRYAFIVSLTVAIGVAAWWYVPCAGPTCAVQRYMAFRPKVLQAYQQASPAERVTLARVAKVRYPEAIWPRVLAEGRARSPWERLTAAADFARAFPYYDPDLQLQWYFAAARVGDALQARAALRSGIDAFSGTAAVGRLVSQSRLDADRRIFAALYAASPGTLVVP